MTSFGIMQENASISLRKMPYNKHCKLTTLASGSSLKGEDKVERGVACGVARGEG